MFTEFDPDKSGHVAFPDFKYALEEKLQIRTVKPLDVQVLAKRYRSNQRSVGEDMVQYEKFFQDYEKLEQLGLRAGFDPLKNKQQMDNLTMTMQQQSVPKEFTAQAKDIYTKMSEYCKKTDIVDKLCESLALCD